MNLLNFWYLLICKPKTFFEEQFEKEKSPYFWYVLLVFGLSYSIDRLDRTFLKYDLKGNYEQLELINNWYYYWGFSIFGAILSGLLFYYFGGWFYNLRVKWSKGTPDKETSRFIYLYSSFIPSLPTVIYSIHLTFNQPKPYILMNEDGGEGIIFPLFILFLIFYGIYVSYQGVCVTMKPAKWLGRIWFLILPVFMYFIALAMILGVFILKELNI